jgi:hypothetical protein
MGFLFVEAIITAILTVRPAKRKATPPARRNPIRMTYMTMMMWKISMKIIMTTSIASKMRKIIMMRHGVKQRISGKGKLWLSCF